MCCIIDRPFSTVAPVPGLFLRLVPVQSFMACMVGRQLPMHIVERFGPDLSSAFGKRPCHQPGQPGHPRIRAYVPSTGDLTSILRSGKFLLSQWRNTTVDLSKNWPDSARDGHTAYLRDYIYPSLCLGGMHIIAKIILCSCSSRTTAISGPRCRADHPTGAI